MNRFRKLLTILITAAVFVTNSSLTYAVHADASKFPDSDYYESFDDAKAAWFNFVSDFDSQRFYISYEVGSSVGSRLYEFSDYLDGVISQYVSRNYYSLNEYNVYRNGYTIEYGYGSQYIGEERICTVYNDFELNSDSRGTVSEINTTRTQAAGIASSWSSLDDYHKVLAINTWLCQNTSYDYESAQQGLDRGHSISSCINDHVTVCEGYAQAFQAMAESLGLQSYIVTGTLDGGPHAWNVVSIGGVNYYMDSTNSDQSWGISDTFILFGTGKAATLGYVCSTGLTISQTNFDPATVTPVPTTTSTPIPTSTSTPIPTATSTPVPTATSTPVPTSTSTPVPTATSTPIPTDTPESTSTSTPTPTETTTPEPTDVPEPGSTSVEMHRLYNPYSGEHFYTSDLSERDMLVTAGWRYEGVAWNAPTSGTPVYRVYNPYTGDHHYTINYSEIEMLVNAGWRYEGIGWYSDDNKASPLYRLYNPNCRGAGSHHYTTRASERDFLISIGWRYEGIGWYGV